MIFVTSISELSSLLPAGRPLVATIGNFDGVHMGHQALIRRVAAKARARAAGSLLVTFEPHPAGVVNGAAPAALSSTEQKRELFACLGLDAVLVLPFTRDLAARPARDFCRDLAGLGVDELLVGHDFRMGSDQADGNALAGECACGMAVTVLPAVKLNGAPISSSSVRKALEAGQLDLVTAMLSRPYAVRGVVRRGEGRGGPLLGFPTANMDARGMVLPPPAVFATTARLADEPDGQPMPSVTSLGRNPTFDGATLSLETHILDFDADIYDRPLEVAFVAPLRREQRFDGPEALKEQIRADVQARRRMEALNRPM